jgi:hypothetical protein
MEILKLDKIYILYKLLIIKENIYYSVFVN